MSLRRDPWLNGFVPVSVVVAGFSREDLDISPVPFAAAAGMLPLLLLFAVGWWT